MSKSNISEHGPTPTPFLAQLEAYDVGQWCPTPDGTGPPEAVVLSIVPKVDTPIYVCGRRAEAVGLRLKSRKAINVLISILERHRDEVFPL